MCIFSMSMNFQCQSNISDSMMTNNICIVKLGLRDRSKDWKKWWSLNIGALQRKKPFWGSQGVVFRTGSTVSSSWKAFCEVHKECQKVGVTFRGWDVRKLQRFYFKKFSPSPMWVCCQYIPVQSEIDMQLIVNTFRIISYPIHTHKNTFRKVQVAVRNQWIDNPLLSVLSDLVIC